MKPCILQKMLIFTDPTPTLCEENANEKDLQHIHDWGELVHCLKIPDHVIDITLTSFTDESYIRRISLEYFVHDHPLKSWWLVYRSLQRVGHLKQARYVKTTYIGEPQLLYMECACMLLMVVVRIWKCF